MARVDGGAGDEVAWENREAWREMGESDWASRPARQRWFHDDVLHPAIVDLVGETTGPILDFGCGDGALAVYLARRTARVVHAYDPSPGMVRAASSALGEGNVVGSLNDLQGARYDAVVANMVLQTVEDLPGVLEEITSATVDDGSIIVSIPHPCFTLLREIHRTTDRAWARAPIDRRSVLEGSLVPLTFYFDQTVEEVSWSRGDANVPTYIFNRSIETWVRSFAAAGLRVKAIEEPRPTTTLDEEGHADLTALFERIPAFMVFSLERVAA